MKIDMMGSIQDDGWILCLIWNGERKGTDLAILNAKDLNEEAILELAYLKIRKSNYSETEKLINDFEKVCKKSQKIGKEDFKKVCKERRWLNYE